MDTIWEVHLKDFYKKKSSLMPMETLQHNILWGNIWEVNLKYYGYFKCITRNCKKCGKDIILMNILKENPGIMESTDKVTCINGNEVQMREQIHVD